MIFKIRTTASLQQ